MVHKRPKAEEIVTKLRQVDVLVGQGKPRIGAIRSWALWRKRTTAGANSMAAWGRTR